MGLAAGQARLLSITSRKADCEFQSMRLSHQKIALSRQLTDLSNEYQNSLDQTKLIYDYYGTGESTMPLTYDILMTPTTLNNYSPIILTDTSGRTVLNSKYASAARSAGIPQEGLGTLPSETMRNAFINGLYSAGIINEKSRDSALMVPYNQGAGNGSGSTETSLITMSGNYVWLLDYIKTNCTSQYTLSQFFPAVSGLESPVGIVNTDTASINTSFTLYDLLSGKNNYGIQWASSDGAKVPTSEVVALLSDISKDGGFIDALADEFASILAYDDITQDAIEYATRELKDLFPANENNATTLGGEKDTDESSKKVRDNYSNYLGVVFTTRDKSVGGKKKNCFAGVNLNNIAQAFITYFADYMNGVSKLTASGNQVFHVAGSNVLVDNAKNHWAKNNALFQYTVPTGKSITTEDAYQAQFWDTLFNQICQNGWTEDSNVDDSEYLQEVLQSGKLFLSRVKDDGYYYQVNYSTDSYIKEVADETLIAQAEAKYNTEKSRLNSKEETLDLKMKNIETEISSLTTEYDTVKNTISKNIEKSFKRYDA